MNVLGEEKSVTKKFDLKSFDFKRFANANLKIIVQIKGEHKLHPFDLKLTMKRKTYEE